MPRAARGQRHRPRDRVEYAERTASISMADGRSMLQSPAKQSACPAIPSNDRGLSARARGEPAPRRPKQPSRRARTRRRSARANRVGRQALGYQRREEKIEHDKRDIIGGADDDEAEQARSRAAACRQARAIRSKHCRQNGPDRSRDPGDRAACGVTIAASDAADSRKDAPLMKNAAGAPHCATMMPVAPSPTSWPPCWQALNQLLSRARSQRAPVRRQRESCRPDGTYGRRG